MKRKVISTLFALVLACSLILVTAVPAGAGTAAYTDAVIAAADRLVATQSDDGGFDWVWDDDLTDPSGDNVLGITAIGILKAYELEAKPGYQTALAKAYGFAKVNTRYVYPDVTFLVLLADAAAADASLLAAIVAEVPETTILDIRTLAESIWTTRMAGGTYGDDEQNLDAAGRALKELEVRDTKGFDGLGFWDLEAAVKAALALGLDADALAIAGVMNANLAPASPYEFDITDASTVCYVLALSGTIEAFSELGVYPATARAMTDELIASQDEAGFWDEVGLESDPIWGESVQATAYAVMALVAQGDADARVAAQSGADWLILRQEVNGGWDPIETGVNYEYLEIDSEAAWALATAGIDSDGDGFTDLEEYLVGADPNNPEDYPGAPVVAVDIVIVPTNGSDTAAITDVASVTATAGDVAGAAVTLAKYSAAPEEESVFGAVGSYVDVHCDTPEYLTEVIIRVLYDDAGMTEVMELSLRMSYWNSDVGDWRQCSDQSVNITGNYIQATITDLTTPDLEYLAGGPFGGGPMSVELDSEWYSTGDTVAVTIEDATQSGLIAASAWSDTVGEFLPLTFALIETDTGIFEGSFDLVNTTPGAGELLVNDGDLITVSYLEVGYTATVDDTAPEITDLTPANSSNTTENKPTISANYSDVGGSAVDNATAVMKVNGSVVAFTATTSSITYTPADNLTDQSYAVTVDVFDVAGNPAEQASWSFTVDTIAPVIADLTPEDTGFVATPTPTISATFSNGGSGIDATSVVIEVDEVDVTVDADVTGSGVSYTPTDNLTDASHAVTVDVSDVAGNPASTAAWSFTVDTTDPVIAIDAVDEDTFLPTQTITGTFTEANLDTINVNGVLATIDGGTWTAANVTLSVGTNPITATAMDKAGNTGVDSTSIEYAPLAAATVTVTSLENEILANGVSTTGITVLVEDEDGTPISEMPVTLETTAGIIYFTSDVTDSDGIVTAVLTSSAVVTTANVTATCEGVTGSVGVSFIADTYDMPDLVVGWNLISLPLIPVTSGIDAVLDDLGVTDQVYVAWSYDAAAGEWYFYEPATGVGDLDYVVDGKGYWVKMLEPATGLTVSGFEMPAPGNTPPEYAVVEGWNLIGFKSTSIDVKAQTYLASIVFTSIYGYDTGGYFSVVGGDELTPGYGYWVYVMAPGYIAP